ncbi:hypothetical protein [Sulfurovum sp.]
MQHGSRRIRKNHCICQRCNLFDRIGIAF